MVNGLHLSTLSEEVPSNQRGQYKVKTVAAAVGLSPTLLRVWERRYDFLRPGRHAGNHRLYSEQDLILLKRVKQMLDSGLAIGEVAALGRENLLKIPTQSPPHLSLTELPGWDNTGIPPSCLQIVLELAPETLTVARSARFAGENLGVSLRALAPADLATVHRIYVIVKSLYELWTYMEQRLVPEVLLGRVTQLRDPDFQLEIMVLGGATDSSDVLVRCALDDTRQGGLTRLLELCREVAPETLVGGELQTMVTLARDHAKMMRNAFYDLDGPLRQADQILKAHELQPVLRKVGSLLWGERAMQVGSNYAGPITCRCLEASTLDRILYDFVERAPAANAGTSALWVAQINEHMTRWAFQWSGPGFRPHQPDDLSAIAVGMAVGLSPEEALAQGYLGTSERDGETWAWFHWPLYLPPADVPLCLCDPMGS
jgi:hypothetical protein